MSLSGDRLAHAEDRAATARANLIASVEALKARLSPKRLVEETVNEARGIGENLVDRGVDVVSRRPGRVAGSVGGVVAVLIARAFLKRRRAAKHHATGPAAGRFNAKRAKARRKRNLG